MISVGDVLSFIMWSTWVKSRNDSIKALPLPSPHPDWSLCSRTHLRPIILNLLHHKYHIPPSTSSISLCGLLKWDATPLEWYNSSSFGLSSLSGSLLFRVTYLGGFLKRSQRKLFHFCSHLTLSNGARWRESWLEVEPEKGYTISTGGHMGRRLNGGVWLESRKASASGNASPEHQPEGKWCEIFTNTT